MDDHTTTELTYEELIINNFVDKPASPTPVDTTANNEDGMPHFLRNNSWGTMDHNGSFHKGFLHLTPEGGYAFAKPTLAEN